MRVVIESVTAVSTRAERQRRHPARPPALVPVRPLAGRPVGPSWNRRVGARRRHLSRSSSVGEGRSSSSSSCSRITSPATVARDAHWFIQQRRSSTTTARHLWSGRRRCRRRRRVLTCAYLANGVLATPPHAMTRLPACLLSIGIAHLSLLSTILQKICGNQSVLWSITVSSLVVDTIHDVLYTDPTVDCQHIQKESNFYGCLDLLFDACNFATFNSYRLEFY